MVMVEIITKVTTMVIVTIVLVAINSEIRALKKQYSYNFMHFINMVYKSVLLFNE